MMLRTVADDKPSLDILEIVRDPTGSPVVMCVLISSASISRLRSSISDPRLIISISVREPTWLDRVRYVHYAALRLSAPQGTIASEIVSRRRFHILPNRSKYKDKRRFGGVAVAQPEGRARPINCILIVRRPSITAAFTAAPLRASCKAGEIVLRFSILK